MFDDSGVSRHIKLPCPLDDCGSSDAFAVYEDGGGHCYSCQKHVVNVEKKYPETWALTGFSATERPHQEDNRYMSTYQYRNPLQDAKEDWQKATELPIRARQISEETVRELGIRLVSRDNKVVKHYYPFRDAHDDIIAFKEKEVKTKKFSIRYMQATSPVTLFGMNLRPKGGKRVVIVEGELDVAACRDMFRKNKYNKNTAVVSVVSGADSARKSFKLKDNFEYVNSFDEIVLALDNDEAGEAARDVIATIFDPKRMFVAPNPELWKDANEALMEGFEEEFCLGISFPVKYKPKGVLSALDLIERALNPKIVKSYPYPWDGLNKKTFGAREGEFVAWLAQTGVGKTSVFECIQYHWLHNHKHENLKLANISLEKNPDETLRALVGLKVNKLLNHPETLPKVAEMCLEDDFKELFGATEEDQNFFIYDGWGSIDIDELVSTIRYYVNVLECNFVFFDHVSLAVSDQRNDDERKALDEITTKLAELVAETGVGLHVISHMNDAGQARGSRNIDKVCWIRIDLERDKNSEDDDIRNTTAFIVDKNRTTGSTGPACWAKWNAAKGGWMDECDKPITPDDQAKMSAFEQGMKTR
jgi:twinkle protein